MAVCGPYTIVFFMIVVFFGAFYLINLMLAVVAMSYDDEAGVNNQENTKKLTDYREESTFSFDPGKLPLVLLEKGHQQNQKKLAIARKKAMLASRNQGPANDYDQPRQHPHVADLVWALAKSEAAKLEAARREAAAKESATKLSDPASPAASATRLETGESVQNKADEIVKGRPVPASVELVTAEDEDEDRVELDFSLHIAELKTQQDNKDCDSGVLFQSSTNFASSFNTDVGYSSETSRAPSYPSSVVFKRRTYTNKSISQNYSSLTESIGSQPADMGLEGELMATTRYSPSPLTPMDSEDLIATRGVRRIRQGPPPPSNGDPRRLSYKRACDPDKRISLAFDSMLSGDSDLSYGSQAPPPAPQPPVDPGGSNGGRSPRDGRRSRRQSTSSSDPLKQPQQQQYVTEGTETDDRWLKRRQSYQKSSGRLNHFQQQRESGRRRIQSRGRLWQSVSLNCCLTVLRFVRSILQGVIQSPWMDFFITISIVLNTAFLAAEHHGMSPDVKHVLDVGNKVSSYSYLFQPSLFNHSAGFFLSSCGFVMPFAIGKKI